MSVILTGMDMPKYCGGCPVDCGYKVYLENMRSEGCPLKSIDFLIEKIERMGGNEEKSVYKNLHPSYVQGLKDVIRIIKEYCEVEDE